MSDSLQVVIRILKLRAWRVGLTLPIQACYFSIFYLGLKTGLSFDVSQLLLLIFSIWLYGAYAVLINDLFDRDVDAQAGKATVARGHGLNPIYMGALLILITLVNSILVLLIRGGVIFNALWVLAYVLVTVYSAPMPNLKARGFLGFLCDSIIEKPLPVLFVFAFFGYYGFEILLFPIFAEMLDSVFKHQARDYQLDVQARVRTFAVVLGEDLSNSLVDRVIHPLNVLLVISIFSVVLLQIPQVRTITLLIFAALLVAFFAFLAKGKKRVFEVETLGWVNPPYVIFFNAGFQTLLICILGIVLTIGNSSYFLSFVLFVLSIVPYLRGYIRIGLRIFMSSDRAASKG